MENKERHGCVTSLLVIMIILNSLSVLAYLFAGDAVAKNLPNGISNTMMTILIVGALANAFFSFMLLQWKRWAFWGCIITSIVAFAVNLSIGIGPGRSMLGVVDDLLVDRACFESPNLDPNQGPEKIPNPLHCAAAQCVSTERAGSLVCLRPSLARFRE